MLGFCKLLITVMLLRRLSSQTVHQTVNNGLGTTSERLLQQLQDDSTTPNSQPQMGSTQVDQQILAYSQRLGRNDLKSDQEEVWEKNQRERQEELRKFEKLIEAQLRKNSEGHQQQPQVQQIENKEAQMPKMSTPQQRQLPSSSAKESAQVEDIVVSPVWSMYGEDPTQPYKFETSKENEASELLDNKVVVFSRRLNYGGLAPDDEKQELPGFIETPDQSFVTFKIPISFIDHFVVFVLFVSVYVKFVLLKKKNTRHQEPADQTHRLVGSLRMTSEEAA